MKVPALSILFLYGLVVIVFLSNHGDVLGVRVHKSTFYRFPKDHKVRKQWIKSLRHADEPGPQAFVCGCHFKDGKKENSPKFFSFNKFASHYMSPEKKKRKLSKPQFTSQVVCPECCNTPPNSKASTRCIHIPQMLPDDSLESVPISILKENTCNLLGPTQPEETIGVPLLSPAALEGENRLLELKAEMDSVKLKYLEEWFSYKKIKTS